MNMGDFVKKLFFLIKISGGKLKFLFFLVFVVQTLVFIEPYFFKLIIDSITNFDKNNLNKILFLIFGTFLANQIVLWIGYKKDLKIIDLTLNIEGELPKLAHQKMLSLSLGYHEKENTGNKIVKIQRGIDKLVGLVSNLFWDIIPTIIQVIVTFAVLVLMDIRFGIIFLFFVPLFLYLTLLGNNKVYPQRIKRHKGYERAAGVMAQSIININTVKSFVQEKREEKIFAKITDSIKHNGIFEFRTMFRFSKYRGMTIDACMVLVMLFGIYLIQRGNITVGSIVFIITISQKAMKSLFRISRLYDRIMESTEPVQRLYALMQEESDIVNSEDGVKPKNIKGQIKFCDVSFCYGDAKERALHKINLKLGAGCTTALVGPSGGGKTTLARMIYRHYDPQIGKVLLDDRDLREYDIHAFRKFMAIVPQEVEIFDTTIGDNIAYAKPDASLDEIKAAAKIANAEEFILKLSQGYNTKVGERGIKLSGGQRQRVGIARAILANPKILIFDEATSSLDSYSERLIQEAIGRISKNRTVIIIAHRLSTIKKADKIVVLEGGELVEQGSHYELSRTDGGLYAKLLNLQKFGDVE